MNKIQVEQDMYINQEKYILWIRLQKKCGSAG